jgi:MFS family permease
MLAPQDHVGPGELDRGLKYLMIDAAFATAIGALNSGVVLLALALYLGASNIQVGILAAIPLLTQVLQAPAVALIEKVRKRRLISVIAVGAARLALPVYAIVPFIPDRQAGIVLLTTAALVHYGLNAVGACSWNSWIRDLVPSDRLGQFSARRSVYATAVGAAATIAAALALRAGERSSDIGNAVFGGLYFVGFLCGLVSTIALARVPEPRMPPPSATAPLLRMLLTPLKDQNFRNMLRFIASWQFAVNLATPFLTVYFVRGLGFSMSFVLALTLVSQLATFSVLRMWGQLSDRFANKSVLLVATPLFIGCLAAMIYADEFATKTAAGTYLILVHLILGMASAGVGLASGNIAMKLSPAGSATSYMATNALVAALAAGVAPIVGGWVSDFFARRALALRIEWRGPAGTSDLFAVAATHWEFFFLLSALIGLYTLHRLSTIEEQGEIERRQVVQHIWLAARRSLRGMSPVGGLRLAVSFPGGELLEARRNPVQRRRGVRRHRQV